MVRKRAAFDFRRKRVRKRLPKVGWTLAQLAQLTRFSQRTIGQHVKHGLLTPPPFRGTATRYQRDHLLRLMAIRFIKAEGLVRLTAVKQRLETMGSAELEAWVLSRPLQKEVVAALQATPGAPAAAPSARQVLPPVVAQSPAGQALATPVVGGELWQRIDLLPGLELSLRSDASPLVQQAARRLTDYLTQLMGERL